MIGGFVPVSPHKGSGALPVRFPLSGIALPDHGRQLAAENEGGVSKYFQSF
jgi:hypothetical protein